MLKPDGTLRTLVPNGSRWERTPWQMFWKPRYRRGVYVAYNDVWIPFVEYATEQQLARRALEEEFNPTRSPNYVA
jgi:hypothetical protein